jgi:hypothetical protein
VLGGVGAHFDICRGAFLDVPKIHHAFDLDDGLLQLIGYIHHHTLHQGAAADGFLHAQLAAFHAARQIDFAFASQQRNGTHLAEVHTDRIVRVDGLFHRGRVQEIGFMGGFWIEEFGVFLEIKSQALRVLR